MQWQSSLLTKRGIALLAVIVIQIVTIVLASLFTSVDKIQSIISGSIFLFFTLFNVLFNFQFWKITENRVFFSPQKGQRVSPKGLVIISIIITSLSLIAVICKLVAVTKHDETLTANTVVTAILESVFLLFPILPFAKAWLTTIVEAYTSAHLLHVTQVCLVCRYIRFLNRISLFSSLFRQLGSI